MNGSDQSEERGASCAARLLLLLPDARAAEQVNWLACHAVPPEEQGRELKSGQQAREFFLLLIRPASLQSPSSFCVSTNVCPRQPGKGAPPQTRRRRPSGLHSRARMSDWLITKLGRLSPVSDVLGADSIKRHYYRLARFWCSTVTRPLGWRNKLKQVAAALINFLSLLRSSSLAGALPLRWPH